MGRSGDGTYRTLVLFADYSDPDAIRVGEDYDMVCSEFHFMGIPLLHSMDLINWRIITRLFDRLLPDTEYDYIRKYGSGSRAPSIHFYGGMFYVYFCTPDEGPFMIRASTAGEWSEPRLIRSA